MKAKDFVANVVETVYLIINERSNTKYQEQINTTKLLYITITITHLHHRFVSYKVPAN